MSNDEKIKNSIKIEFVDYNGDKHMFYNEEAPSNQVEFVGKSLAKFFKSIGWSETVIDDALESLQFELNCLK